MSEKQHPTTPSQGDPGPFGTSHDRALAEDREAGLDPEYQAALDRLDFTEGIARELIRLRMHLKVSQAELARRVGTTASVISRLERGNHEPSTATLRKIADATGTRIVIHFAGARKRASSRQPIGRAPVVVNAGSRDRELAAVR